MKKLSALRETFAPNTLTVTQTQNLKGGVCDKRRRVIVSATGTSAYKIVVTMP